MSKAHHNGNRHIAVHYEELQQVAAAITRNRNNNLLKSFNQTTLPLHHPPDLYFEYTSGVMRKKNSPKIHVVPNQQIKLKWYSGYIRFLLSSSNFSKFKIHFWSSCNEIISLKGLSILVHPIHFVLVHGSGVAPVCSYLVIETRNYLRESFLTD